MQSKNIFITCQLDENKRQFQRSKKPKCVFFQESVMGLYIDSLLLFLELHSCFGSLFCKCYFANVMRFFSKQILVNGADNTFISLS